MHINQRGTNFKIWHQILGYVGRSATSDDIWWGQVGTLYNDILRIARNLLETRENTKIESHPFYHIIYDWFSWGSSKKKFKMANFSKWPFFKIANSQNLFVKISWIGPWVGRIDWCEGHWPGSTYMVVKQCGRPTVRHKHKKCLKTPKCIFCLFLSLCRTASRLYRLSHINVLHII